MYESFLTALGILLILIHMNLGNNVLDIVAHHAGHTCKLSSQLRGTAAKTLREYLTFTKS